jgi:hypothetical protein
MCLSFAWCTTKRSPKTLAFKPYGRQAEEHAVSIACITKGHCMVTKEANKSKGTRTGHEKARYDAS